MPFVATRRALLSRPAAAGGGWWDNDGAIAGCTAAYRAIGAANIAASQVNLANPGTYDLVKYGANPPLWSAGNGWYSFATNGVWTPNGLYIPASETNTVIIRWAPLTGFSASRDTLYGRGAGQAKDVGNWGVTLNYDFNDTAINGDSRTVGNALRSGKTFAVNASGVYYNGSLLAWNVSGTLGFSGDAFGIGAMINDADGTLSYADDLVSIQAFVLYDAVSLSNTDMGTIITAMAALT